MQSFVLDIETAALPDAADYIKPVSAPDNYKRPEAIAAYQAEALQKAIGRAALDPDLGQIISLGLMTPDGNVQVHTADKVTEREMLTWFWEAWGSVPWEERQFVTYNGTSFDIPYVKRRSLYLNVKHPQVLCGRYKHPQILDLMTWLSEDDRERTKPLSFYLAKFKYPHAGQDVTGKDIASLYAAGNWAAIAEHCRMDVDGTAWLAERIGVVPARQTTGAF
jgi:predicted PolB exonuclease-like 3'-5' exonuclease